eukprot:6197588-Pleurochrysis_carterae.AAC.5
MASDRARSEKGARRSTCQSNRPPRRMKGNKLPDREEQVAHGGYTSHVCKCVITQVVMQIPHGKRKVAYRHARTRFTIYPGDRLRARSHVARVSIAETFGSSRDQRSRVRCYAQINMGEPGYQWGDSSIRLCLGVALAPAPYMCQVVCHAPTGASRAK